MVRDRTQTRHLPVGSAKRPTAHRRSASSATVSGSVNSGVDVSSCTMPRRPPASNAQPKRMFGRAVGAGWLAGRRANRVGLLTEHAVSGAWRRWRRRWRWRGGVRPQRACHLLREVSHRTQQQLPALRGLNAPLRSSARRTAQHHHQHHHQHPHHGPSLGGGGGTETDGEGGRPASKIAG